MEYIGLLDKTTLPKLTEELERVTNELIKNSSVEDTSIVKMYEYDVALKEFDQIPNYLPVGKPFRWVKLLNNDVGCPCGGTHVKHIKDIEQMKITKITSKGKVTRISYNVISS